MIFSKYSLAALVALFCVLAALPVQALSIATVRMERVYTSYHKQETMRTQFLAEREKAQAEATRRQEAFQQRVNRLQQMGERLQNDASLTGDARAELEQEAQSFLAQLQREEQELVEWRDELVEGLSIREGAARDAILEEIKVAVAALAKEMNFDLVLDTSDPMETGVPTVFFAQSALDITEKVIAKINANKPAAR
ncbi:MAG: OmpH family outer membrane protein [Verrucomicrobia bacterium]|nr:OmpH family outer membrane protein [Verrucomicrobiota bacterium]